MRGYAAIALVNPKTGENVGGAMRACGVYGAAMVVVTGRRFAKFRGHPCDTMRAWKHIPLIEADTPFDALPYDCVPVAIEINPEARMLPSYTHPERAMYIFGQEDGSLSPHIITQCRDLVAIPTLACLNLAVCVATVLYDRKAKQGTTFN